MSFWLVWGRKGNKWFGSQFGFYSNVYLGLRQKENMEALYPLSFRPVFIYLLMWELDFLGEEVGARGRCPLNSKTKQLT